MFGGGCSYIVRGFSRDSFGFFPGFANSWVILSRSFLDTAGRV